MNKMEGSFARFIHNSDQFHAQRATEMRRRARNKTLKRWQRREAARAAERHEVEGGNTPWT